MVGEPKLVDGKVTAVFYLEPIKIGENLVALSPPPSLQNLNNIEFYVTQSTFLNKTPAQLVEMAASKLPKNIVFPPSDRNVLQDYFARSQTSLKRTLAMEEPSAVPTKIKN